MPVRYDAIAIVIGTEAGGGTLALQLAQAGKKILILERGPFMPQEKLNWDTSAVFLDNRYHTKETWQDKNGKDLHPQQSYFVGGQTKVFGAAMFHMRAEELFHVHGDLGSAPAVPSGYGSSFDPTEPFHSKKYSYPALVNEPRMQSIEDSVRKLGINTFLIPLGLKRDEAAPLESKCVRCDTCDGYPCLVHAKSDADINCIRQILHLPNVMLMTNARATRLLTNARGTSITGVEVIHTGSGGRSIGPDNFAPPSASGQTVTYSADLFCLCAGAVNSAVVLLASANDKHLNGLANSSDQVGRNFMVHQADALLAISTDRNEDSYTKTWGTNDFYLGDPDPSYPYPLGQTQPIGSFHYEMMKRDAPPLTPGFVLETMKHHAVPWWLTTEDLPDAENRITLHNTTPLSVQNKQPGLGGPHSSGDTGHTNESENVSDNAPYRIQLSYTPNNVESFERLKDRWVDILKKAGHAATSMPLHAYFKKRIPLEGVGHQNGTCRMGSDPSSSVLDPNCKAHDLDNLYVVDASCFVSASAVNPSLTIIANAIRIADHLLSERLK